jgi:hypothetical protein
MSDIIVISPTGDIQYCINLTLNKNNGTNGTTGINNEYRNHIITIVINISIILCMIIIIIIVILLSEVYKII